MKLRCLIPAVMPLVMCGVAVGQSPAEEATPEAALAAADAAAERDEMQRILSDFVRALSSGYTILPEG